MINMYTILIHENEEIENRTEGIFKQFSNINLCHQTTIPESSVNTHRINKTILKEVACFKLSIKD